VSVACPLGGHGEKTELAVEELLKIDGSSYPKDERIKSTQQPPGKISKGAKT
jgi:hypothetical protein